MPVDRIVGNLEAHLEKSPNDTELLYALGRVHSYAYVTGVDLALTSFRGGDGPIWPMRDVADPNNGPNIGDVPHREAAIPRQERLEHLELAVRRIERALEIGFDQDSHGQSKRTAAAHLSLAYVLEQGADDSRLVEIIPDATVSREMSAEQNARLDELIDSLPDDPPAAVPELQRFGEPGIEALKRHREMAPELIDHAVRNHWLRTAARHYLRAFDITIDQDLERPLSMGGDRAFDQLISHEAAESFLRLVDRARACPPDAKREQEVRRLLRKLKKKRGGGMVTPIIFPRNQPAQLVELLAQNTTVAFDLDGTGRPQRWPWVQPTTAILVWDPLRTGEITSGRQLFGSVTWWIFFPNGYRALDALDDDRDGELAGAELRGLSIWLDADSDGVSDPGEVRPIERTNIAGISTDWITRDGLSYANPRGLRLRDGRELPTYDWVAREIAAPAEKSND